MDAKKQCVSNEAKEIYDLPCKKLVQISERVVELNSRIGILMRESLTCSKYLRIWNQEHSGLLAKVNLDEGLSAEEKYALAQFTVALATGPSTWKYFAALPTMALINALLMYRDTNISFLGRSPGKRYDPRAAINVLLQVGADAIIDAATFNFGSALLHAADAAMTSPVEKDIANLRAAATQLERVFQLKAALK